ncbi:MAG: NAD(P)H-hydrate dehydratase [Sandaracinaceae bacterium]|nr:NAD(P)H-hydrate dehydratase [Sandaracinaceae bacterium]
MRPLFGREAARELDRRAMEAGVPGLLLMENAGQNAARVLLERFAGRLDRVLVVGGTGQNGGDAWVIARRLRIEGFAPRALLAGDLESVRGDARINFDAMRAVGVDAQSVQALPAGPAPSLVVDGVFGTGLDRPVDGWRAELLRALDALAQPIFSLDLPSGIDCDTGQVLGAALHASVTVTFAAHKRGLWQFPGRGHAGEILCTDIGVPAPPLGREGLLGLGDAALPRHPADAHKGTAGHVWIVAGSPGKTGAAVLCGAGASRAGAGLVTLAARGAAHAALDAKVVELMTYPLGEGASAIDAALAGARGKSAAAVGPGLGLDDEGRALAIELALQLSIPAVLDADALTALAEHRADHGLERLREAAAPRVLTPHPGEAARLMGRATSDVQADRYRAASELAERSGQVVVLKGASSVVASPDGRLAVCPFGTPALGSGGTGDVLAGAIAALLGQERDVFRAACAAIVLHARAGELAARSDRGLLASEVAAALPLALEEARLTA